MGSVVFLVNECHVHELISLLELSQNPKLLFWIGKWHARKCQVAGVLSTDWEIITLPHNKEAPSFYQQCSAL